MTSKTSSSKFGKLVMFRFRQLAWLTTLWSAVLFFILPVYQFMQLEMLTSHNVVINNPRYNVNRFLADENYLVLAGVLVAGIIAACVVQAFMNSKTQNDFWFSLPMRREKLFAVNLTAGGMAVLIPLTVAYILASVLTGLTPAGKGMFDFSAVFMGYLRAVGLFMVAYAITTLWCVLSGRTIIAVLCSLFTPLIGSAALGLTVILFLMEFKTFYPGEQTLEALIALCPFAPFFAALIPGKLMTVMDIVWTAAAIGLLFLSVRLYQKRPSEKAGDPLAYPKALPIVKYPLVFFSVAAGWIFFKEVMGTAGWEIFGAISIGLCVFCFINVLEKFQFKNILHYWWKFLVTAAVFGLCIGVLILDPFSYDTRLPARGKITEAKVYQLTINGVNLNPSSDNQQTITDSEIIDTLYSLSQIVVGQESHLDYNSSLGYRNDWPYFDRTNLSAEKVYANQLIYQVDYNGFTRHYSAYLTEDQTDLLYAVFCNPQVVMATNGAYAYTHDQIETMTFKSTNSTLTYTVKDSIATGPEGSGPIGDIVYALRSDALVTTAKTLRNAHLLCVIYLQARSTDEPVGVPVYDYFTEIRDTWLWPVIEKHMIKTDPALIESIQLNRLYDKYSETITDPGKITELAPALITTMDADYNPLVSSKNGYRVTVIYKDGSVSYPVLCDQQLPDWLSVS